VTAREKQDLELLPKGFNEQELNKFIDGLPPKEPAPVGKPAGQPRK
jgi:hypothetical protein